MKYKIQRRLFNFEVLLCLICYLLYDIAPSSIRAYIRNRKLRKLIKKAYTIPFYKARFDQAGVRPCDIKTPDDLTKLPVLTKEEYRTWVNQEIEKKENKECMIMYTSGSSGKPLKVINTPFEYARDIANLLRMWIYSGANPVFMKTLTERDDSSETVGYKTLIQRMGIMRREIIDEDDEEETIISFINRYKPDILRFYKSELVRIGLFSKRKGIPLYKPKYYIVLGENVDLLSERTLRECYGDGLINLYGCVEAGGIAVKKPHETNYEVFEDAVIINIYGNDSSLSTKGRVIMTTLYKDTFPLINYDLKDIAEVEETKRGVVIKEILGRTDDDLMYEDGSSTGWIRIWHIACEQQDLLQIHIIQESYKNLIVQCVKNPDSKISESVIEEGLRKGLEKEILGRMTIEFEWLDDIPLDSNGKLKLIEKRFL